MKIIKYRLATEINHGTPELPDIETVLSNVTMPYTEANYQLALSEAWQGEVTVEEVPETAEEIRARRDKLLADTDWTQTLDAPHRRRHAGVHAYIPAGPAGCAAAGWLPCGYPVAGAAGDRQGCAGPGGYSIRCADWR